jgi:hypothetical protein
MKPVAFEFHSVTVTDATPAPTINKPVPVPVSKVRFRFDCERSDSIRTLDALIPKGASTEYLKQVFQEGIDYLQSEEFISNYFDGGGEHY